MGITVRSGKLLSLNEIVEVIAKYCELCGSTDLENKDIEKRIIEEIPPPLKIKVIQFNRHVYKYHNF